MPSKQIPMVAPDGTPGMVDAESAQQAADMGYRPGMHMIAPDGTPGVVKFTDLKDALGSGYKPANYTDPSTTTPDSRTFMQSAADATGIPAALSQNPIKTLMQIGSGIVKEPGRIASEVSQGWNSPTVGGAIDHALYATPFVGAGLKAADQQYNGGNVSGSLGTVLGTLAPIAAGEGVAAMRGGAPPSPVSAAELSARKITQAINPAQGFQSVVDAMQAHGGDVVDYAKRNNIGITGKLDYSKAARGAADETLAQYRQVLDPHAGVTVPVSENYQGALARNPGQGVGRYANLGDINTRIGDINDLIRAADNAKTDGAAMTARERLGLDAEHAELTGKLHQGLADAVGTTPDNIAALRQKFGKLYTLADATNAATNKVAGTEAAIDQGTRVGHPTVAGVALEAINRLRGGPQAISDRALVSAVRKSPIQPTNVSRFLTAQALRSVNGQ
jgi:hypothetical protein